MRKSVSTLLLLVLLAYAAFKGTVWWFADQGLEQARQVQAADGVLKRGTIGSSVAGLLVLSNPSYQPFQLTQAFKAERLTFKTEGPVALLGALVNPGKLPDAWQLEIEGVSLRLDATMFRNWVTATDSESPNLFAPVCGPDHRQRLGSGDLVRIGISKVAGEMVLNQTDAGLHAELTTEGSGSVEINWPGARLSLPDFVDLRVASTQPVTVTLRDGGVMRKVAAYCAQESGVAVSEWTQIVMSAFLHGLQSYGYQPSQQMLALYRQWLTEGGEVVVQLRPVGVVYGVPVLASEDEAPGLPVNYNGFRVPGVFLQRTEPPLQSTPVQAREPVVPDDESSDGTGWHTVVIDHAQSWAGHRVKVTLTSGRVAVGRLVAVTDKQLEVARKVNGGEVTYPLAVGSVTGFEVWRRNHRL